MITVSFFTGNMLPIEEDGYDDEWRAQSFIIDYYPETVEIDVDTDNEIVALEVVKQLYGNVEIERIFNVKDFSNLEF
jgi:hypothetical protein